jgi:hypothetical protein
MVAVTKQTRFVPFRKIATHPSFAISDIHPKCMVILVKFPHAYCCDFGIGFRRASLTVAMFL